MTLSNTSFLCYLNFLAFYLQIGESKMLEMHFSANLRALIFKILWGSMPPDPLQGVRKIFLAPARFETFSDHNLQVLDSTRLAGLNKKDFY